MSTQMLTRNFAEAVALQTSAVQTTSGNSAAAVANGVHLPTIMQGIDFELDLTAAAAAVGDTLDVYIQTCLDQTNWVDVVHFTQALGNGGAKRFFAKITAAAAEAMFENGSALAGGSVRNLFGDVWRVRWVVADGGAHGQSFTFAVWACPF